MPRKVIRVDGRGDDEEAPNLPPWRNCEAKKQLIRDILDGTINGMEPRDVHAFRPLYYERAFKKFSTNLRNLRKDLNANQDRADSDAAALAHDEALNLRKNSKPYPQWQGSEAARLLKLDLDLKKQLRMKPCLLHSSREEYMEYPLDVFRGHIQQELRERTERPYWLARKAEKEAKKLKKKKEKPPPRPPPKRVTERLLP